MHARLQHTTWPAPCRLHHGATSPVAEQHSTARSTGAADGGALGGRALGGASALRDLPLQRLESLVAEVRQEEQ